MQTKDGKIVNQCTMLRWLGKDKLLFIRTGEDGAGIGTIRDDGAIVMAREIDRSHDQLASYS